MKRRNFLKLLGLGSVVATLVPKALAEKPYVIWEPYEPFPGVRMKRGYMSNFVFPHRPPDCRCNACK